jgi:hypothetical protein
MAESESDRFDRKMKAMYGSKHYCVVCGKMSTVIDRAGRQLCDDHRSTQEDIAPSTLPETTPS